MHFPPFFGLAHVCLYFEFMTCFLYLLFVVLMLRMTLYGTLVPSFNGKGPMTFNSEGPMASNSEAPLVRGPSVMPQNPRVPLTSRQHAKILL